MNKDLIAKLFEEAEESLREIDQTPELDHLESLVTAAQRIEDQLKQAATNQMKSIYFLIQVVFYQNGQKDIFEQVPINPGVEYMREMVEKLYLFKTDDESLNTSLGLAKMHLDDAFKNVVAGHKQALVFSMVAGTLEGKLEKRKQKVEGKNVDVPNAAGSPDTGGSA